MDYSADGLNRITAANANAYSYDGNGNLTSDSLTAYVYDVENRLISASGQNTAGLRYDPFGRLYEVSDGAAGVRRFLHDGDDLVAEYGSNGTMLARHLHGLGSGDDPLITFPGASASHLDVEYLYTDRLGSVIARYRRDGTPAAINSYDEFGVPGPSSDVNNNGRFRYTGQVWLPELGLNERRQDTTASLMRWQLAAGRLRRRRAPSGHKGRCAPLGSMRKWRLAQAGGMRET